MSTVSAERKYNKKLNCIKQHKPGNGKLYRPTLK